MLKEGDIVNVDLTTIVNGWFGDQSETFMIGEVSDEAKRLVQTTFDSLWVGIRAVETYGRVFDIGRAIYEYATERKYGVVREYQGEDPALKRLARNGSITGEVQNRDTLRPRQVYAVTAAGVEKLQQHLRQPVTRDDVMRHADGVMLRFVFAGEVLGRDQAIRVLEQFTREIESYLSDLERQLADFPATAAPYGRCALQHGIDMYHASACWARNAAKELGEQATARLTGRESHTRR